MLYREIIIDPATKVITHKCISFLLADMTGQGNIQTLQPNSMPVQENKFIFEKIPRTLIN